MNEFLAAGMIFLLAIVCSRLLGRARFPAVTSYLVLGVLMGPYVLKLVPPSLLGATDKLASFVLGIVAFNLGQNFLWRRFRKIRKAVLGISCGEAVGAAIAVAVCLLIIGRPLQQALLFGAIACATAPMATIMVLRELRARGHFAETLMDVVAVDDAWGLIIFALCLGIVKVLDAGAVRGVYMFFTVAGRELLAAGLLGFVLGLILSLVSRYSKTQTDSLIFSLGFVLFTTGVSIRLDVSPLLANMVLGTTVVNLTKRHLFFDVLKKIDWPFYLLFFVLCGASLEIPLLKDIKVLGITYIVARVVAKYGGAYLGGHLAGVEHRIKKYIGLGLIPQAGVALGLALMVKGQFPETGAIISTTIVATTVVFELAGPFCTRFAVTRAGEGQHANREA